MSVGREELVIPVEDGQVHIPRHAISGIEEHPVVGRHPVRTAVIIACDRLESFGENDIEIALMFTNGYFAKEFALRLRLATRSARLEEQS